MIKRIQRTLAAASALAALFTAGPAAAGDNDYPIATWSEAYTDLASPTVLADTKAQPFASTYSIRMPADFTLRYYGQNSTGATVYVMGDGAIQLLRPPFVGYYFNESFPFLCQQFVFVDGRWQEIEAPGQCGEPLIAAWWDTWQRNSNSPFTGGISYEIDGVAPHRVLKVQWKNFTNQDCNDSNEAPPCAYAKSYSWQAWIHESPDGIEKSLIQFRYATPLDGDDPNPDKQGGDETGNAFSTTLSGTVGVQSSDEHLGSDLACSPGCQLGDWRSDQVVMFGQPARAELIVAPAASSVTGSRGDANVTLAGASTLRNLGATRAGSVHYSYYFTKNDILDVTTDTLIGESPGGYDIEASGSVDASNKPTDRVVASDSFTFPRPADGFYRLCAFVDDRKAIAEDIEDNNQTCSRSTFGIGVDLGGQVLAIPAQAGPNDDMPIHLRVVDNGTDASGPFAFKVYMSAKVKLDATAKLIYSGTLDLTNGTPYDATVHVELPKDIIGNQENNVDRHVILSIDPDNAVAELDEANNTVVSKGVVNIVKPDLRLDMASAQGLDKGCYFGNPISATFTVFNEGAARARDYQNALVLSDNSVITGFDQVFVLSPPSCTMDDDCVGTLGEGSTCSVDRGSCTKPCVVDDDCVDASRTSVGLSCFAPPDGSPSYCSNVLPGHGSTLLTINGTIPTTDNNGADLQDGQRFFGAVADFTDQVAEGNEGNNTKVLGQFLCQKPAPDFVPTLLETSDVGAAGELLAIHRVIGNAGIVGGSTTWKYYLSSNPIISSQDIELPLAGGPASVTLDPHGSNDGVDLVVLPSFLARGSYYLGMVINPADEGGNHATHELTYDNNTLRAASQIDVRAAKLRIVTSSLPPAVLGLPYTQQLVALGGSGDYSWSTPLPEELPHDLSLTVDGILTGVASDRINAYTFHVRVTSGSISTDGLLVLAVTPSTGPLTITTDVLPPGYADVKYQVDLVAQGGNPPYAWVLENRLPDGLALRNSIVSGVPSTPDGMSSPLKPRFKVTDSRGQTVEADFVLPILTRADLSVQTPHLVDALVGSDYLQIVRGAGGEPPYQFDVTGLPAGLSWVSKPPTAAEIKGAPLAAGQFDITISIEDALHQHASQVYRFAVIGQPIKIRTTGPLPDANRNGVYETTLTSSATGGLWSIFAGVLPAGVTLDEHTGVLSGTVSATAAYRLYPFVVKIDDGHGGEGFASYSIDLPAPEIHYPDRRLSTGCDSGGSRGSPITLALVIGATLLLRRRR